MTVRINSGAFVYFVGATMTVAGLTAAVNSAQAGGFAVREQSAVHQGASFAGSASGDDLSSMYWNPAAVTAVDGFNTSSSYAIVLPNSDVDITSATFAGAPVPLAAVNPGFTSTNSGEIGNTAVVGASYGNYQLGNVYVGFGFNAPFGLVTEPETRSYSGSGLSRTADVFNLVGTPTLGFKVMPGVSVAAGVQIGYMDGTLKFGGNAGPSPFNNNIGFNGDDYALGWTVGVMLEPASGTRIGVGYRSAVTYDLEGQFFDNVTGRRFNAEAELETPDIFTVSITQAVSSTMRVLGTFEWTQWSKFDQLDINAQQGGVVTALAAGGGGTLPTAGISVAGQTFASLETNWDDAWFASLGFEMDIDDRTMVRAGIAYEESPIQNATQRITPVPDSDRIWLSAGATHQLFENTTLDFAYTHIFIDDAPIERSPISNSNVVFFGNADDQSVDIFTIGIRQKLGG